ncbi:MAG TPA: flagellar basal body P-ring protein FlgI [Phycisphaerae bacterium]|nr:flagellar basal body P-ring protein FlgI [Phycisphaerae bacterium]HUT59981.1 flagellar basal body P-ring protein FlgI [Phycisphaerae bacterium]
MRRLVAIAVVVLALVLPAPQAGAERIKDIVNIKGIRGNPLHGYGLVIGLNGTGDNSALSRRALTNILRRSGLVLKPDDLASKNIASVLVTAELPPFSRNGAKIDVTVSAIGDASSLQGGTLLMTGLVGADGQVYAVSQGAISVGGFAATGQAGSVSNNHPTVGRIPSGATVEREELATFVENGHITLQLRNDDFTTAQRIAEAIQTVFPRSVTALDAGAVRVEVPQKLSRRELVGFIDRVLALEVKVDQPAVVVINERTGTIIVGERVTISSVAISHGNLSIVTQEKDYVSQPLPLSKTGTTEKVHRTDIKTVEEKSALVVMPRVSVSELAKALNAMGLTPRDLIAIFEALRQAGALQAELKII